MTESIWPSIDRDSDVIPALKEMQRVRENEDIPNFNNLINRFIQGRSTTRVPSSPSDVLATDNLGDCVISSGFKYELIDVGGTPTWARTTLNTTW